MPIIRRVMEIGGSKVIAIPKSWVVYYERSLGKQIKEVAIEVNEVLKIFPFVKEGRMERKPRIGEQ